MTDPLPPYEKLGAFYLGRTFDVHSDSLGEKLVLYDSKDLTTHAVIVGMTGSGKTGLGIGLLEEAAIDGIPALIVDPKGDLSNLLLNFPDLKPTDFAPWIHAEDAQRQGISAGEYAELTANKWTNGLADWHQDGRRIARLRESAEFRIYTPGSDAGRPVSIVSSFGAPPAQVVEDGDLFRDRISTTANSLLGLLGIDADPLRSREHILITMILDGAWREGRDLDLGTLIQQVQTPSFNKVGVMDLDAFYPSKERFELAMALNNLLAAPSFSTWLRGDPLNVDQLLYTDSGKPCLSIFSIAHLSESERMFFVSLLLNETLGWMRGRPGTTSLSALLYIDEIFGYMPPVSEPPSKKPLLTLLKQARAFGLGVVLSTQNPVDLDYKGLSNAGTWFLGRLQTERDKDRVLDGLQGANDGSNEFDRKYFSELLSGVGQRVFLMHNVHESPPVTFQTRWTMSYLAGPMTRDQIRSLNQQQPREPAAEVPRDAPPVPPHLPAGRSGTRPTLPDEIHQLYSVARSPANTAPETLVPYLMARAKVNFVDSRRDLSADEELMLLLEIDEETVDFEWANAQISSTSDGYSDQPPQGECRFGRLPSSLRTQRDFLRLEKPLADHLYHKRRFDFLYCAALKAYAKPRESERDFRIRLAQNAREARDDRVNKLRKKYASRLQTLDDRIDRAELAVQREQSQASEAKMQSVLSLGANILAFFGSKKKLSSTNINRASRSARGIGRASRQADDVEQAEQKLESFRQQEADLEADMQTDIDEIRRDFDPQSIELDTIQLKPRRTDIGIHSVGIAWIQASQEARA